MGKAWTTPEMEKIFRELLESKYIIALFVLWLYIFL